MNSSLTVFVVSGLLFFVCSVSARTCVCNNGGVCIDGEATCSTPGYYVCVGGTSRCTGGTGYCVGGQGSCETGTVDQAGGCVGGGTCVGGNGTCVGGSLSCTNGGSQIGICPAGVGTCIDGTAFCVDGTPPLCDGETFSCSRYTTCEQCSMDPNCAFCMSELTGIFDRCLSSNAQTYCSPFSPFQLTWLSNIAMCPLVLQRNARLIRQGGTGSSDPHLQTLDGRYYDFNGKGEYHLMKSFDQTPEIDIQVRFEQCGTAPATCITGLAFNSGGNRVSLYTTGAGDIQLLVDGSEETSFPLDLPSGLNITKQTEGNTTEIFLLFPPPQMHVRYSVIATGTSPLTQLSVSWVSLSLTTKLKGLLGFYDVNLTNDFEFFNGTVLGDTPTDQQLFEFGESWRVEESDSLFDYTNASYNQINDPSFVPVFFSDLVPSSDALNACADLQGQDTFVYTSCLMDVTLTGDANFVLAGELLLEEPAKRQAIVNSFPPPEYPVEPTEANSPNDSSDEPVDADSAATRNGMEMLLGLTAVGVVALLN